MSLVPPPPPGPAIPEPPSFGWIPDPRHLTVNEMLEIAQHLGSDLPNLQGQHMLPYAAVAYARREDPEKYSWDIAGNMPVMAMAEYAERLANQQAEEEAAGVAAAVENGQEYLGPS